ncbi:MAG: hypothetical protein AABX29_02485 [Nanoarchaeota archaeon]
MLTLAEEYKEIHIWDFPPTLTFIRLNKDFRLSLFNKMRSLLCSRKKLMLLINKSSLKYNIKRSYNDLTLYSWMKGFVFKGDKIKNINLPLWLLIEFSKIISKNENNDNFIMRDIEKNIDYYTGWGKSNPIINPKFPLYLTPEMVSVIFHFLGDGHIGKKEVCSSYRQMNEEGLNNFLSKLKNLFGDFNFSKNEFKDGRLNIPKILTEFYNYYFKLPNTDTFEAYVPLNIKSLDKEFLLAGLASFIVDEGHVWEVITIYSKNKALLEGIREVTIKCGYIAHPIREKYARGKFDCYRFSISSKSYNELYSDLKVLSDRFPTCSLAHKSERLIKQIH